MKNNVILQIDDLASSYSDFKAVESATLKINQGEIVSLIGSNGAGKSTLINCVCGLHKATSGKVYFKNEDITNLPANKIVSKGLSLVPQGGRCFNRMTVHDNLLMGGYPKQSRKSSKQAVDSIYELFPVLFDKRLDPAGSLSGGQRQMVAIGRALMAQPQCIIFDEISLGLSPSVIKDIYKTIKKINEDFNTSILLIEQDTQRALKASDSFYVMLKGKAVLSGDSKNVDPKTLKEAYFGIG